MPADITVRRADPVEADLVGELTERVYRDGGFGSGAYAEVLRDGRSRVRVGAGIPLDLARQLAGWGAQVSVESPAEVRTSLARLGAELVAAYGGAAEN